MRSPKRAPKGVFHNIPRCWSVFEKDVPLATGPRLGFVFKIGGVYTPAIGSKETLRLLPDKMTLRGAIKAVREIPVDTQVQQD